MASVDMGRWIDRLRLRTVLPVLPALGGLALVLLAGPPSPLASVALFAIVVAVSVVAIRGATRDDRHRLRTFGNLLEALRGGDYAVRSAARDGDGQLFAEQFNALATHLHDEQRAQQEGLQLLANALAALDGAVFAFDRGRRLRWVNPAGSAMLGDPVEGRLGCSADELGLAPLFDLPSGTVDGRVFGGTRGRWQVKHSELRSRSQSGWLLVLQPIERELREEEAQAFKRMLRVLSHEINNSMAPIASMADTIGRLLPPPDAVLDPESRDDIADGLGLIEQRSQALQRFLGGYARLARLPAPNVAPFPLAPLCERVARLLDGRVDVEVADAIWLHADIDQIEQVLINLVRNALEAGGTDPVRVCAETDATTCRLRIVDGGDGLPASDSLFVPFFTTKPGGSGIGLVLSRQIVEAQGGTLALRPGADGYGAVAEITLPAGRPPEAEHGAAPAT